MELALICAQQVIVLFLLIGVGTLAVKTGVLKLEHKQPLSNLLVNIVVPAMIVNSYQMEFSLEILRNLLAAFGLSILTIALGTVLTMALTARRKNSRTAIFRFASIFSNAAYMGFPLISACSARRGCFTPAPMSRCSTSCSGRWATAWSAAALTPKPW